MDIHLLNQVEKESIGERQPLPERALRGGDPRVHLVFGQAEILLGQRLALPDAFLLDLVQKLDVHWAMRLPASPPPGP